MSDPLDTWIADLRGMGDQKVDDPPAEDEDEDPPAEDEDDTRGSNGDPV